MTGMSAKGIKAGVNQVGEALKEVNPTYHQRRVTRTEVELNPFLTMLNILVTSFTWIRMKSW